MYTSNIQNLFLQGVILSLWASHFTIKVTYSTEVSNKILDFSMQRNYFSLFSTFIHTINHLDQFDLTKNYQTFSAVSMRQNKGTV